MSQLMIYGERHSHLIMLNLNTFLSSFALGCFMLFLVYVSKFMLVSSDFQTIPYWLKICCHHVFTVRF